MPFSFQALALIAALVVPEARAVQDGPLHWSGERTKWNRKTDIVELSGRASVQQLGESITADDIVLNLDDRTVKASGSCRYVTADTVIHSEKMDFNLDTRTGTIYGGRVTNGQFMLSGERIDRLSDVKYVTKKGEYTTCIDCPSSWSLMGEDVELEFEGYAYMKDVKMKVQGTPVAWLPYAILPIKRKRQSGLLFPRFAGTSNHGFIYVQPFFWNISRSADMTIGAGRYFLRGHRLEWEGRYALSDFNVATIDAFYTQDRTKPAQIRGAGDTARWGLNGSQTHRLPFGVEEKLRLLEVSDNFYPIDFFGDMPGQFEPVLTSRLSLTKVDPSFSSYVELRRIRNLIEFNEPNKFDPKTVQVTPKVLVTTNDRLLFGLPVAVGLTGELTRFERSDGNFDYDPSSTPGAPYTPGVDPLRHATRLAYTPSLYATFRPFKVLSLVPSVEYRGFFYAFNDAGLNAEIPTLNRGYLHAQVELSMQFEKVYERDDKDVSKVKHLIRPLIRYSRIPVFNEPEHPFLKQFSRTPGYNFDNQDIVPRSVSPSLVNYFTPLGNSLTYGVTSQVIRKRGTDSAYRSRYERLLELSLGQSVDFLQLDELEAKRVPFSRFQSSMLIQTDKIASSTDYNFIPYLTRYPGANPYKPSPHEFRTSFSYLFQRTFKTAALEFNRSLSLGYNWNSGQSRASFMGLGATYSLSDYFMPSALVEYDFARHVVARTAGYLTYQSPSECWKFTLGMTRFNDRRGNVFEINFQLNLSGTGYNAPGTI